MCIYVYIHAWTCIHCYMDVSKSPRGPYLFIFLDPDPKRLAFHIERFSGVVLLLVTSDDVFRMQLLPQVQRGRSRNLWWTFSWNHGMEWWNAGFPMFSMKNWSSLCTLVITQEPFCNVMWILNFAERSPNYLETQTRDIFVGQGASAWLTHISSVITLR